MINMKSVSLPHTLCVDIVSHNEIMKKTFKKKVAGHILTVL